MKLTQVKGNTWVIEANQFIPLYRLPENRCILLDTGLREEREELEETLLQAGLTPAGILCSHAHIDHCANNGYLQEKYGIPVALTAPEAGMCSNLLTLKCYMLMLTPKMVEQDLGAMVHTPDVVIPSQDGPFSFAGAEFQIIQTPGHSPGHMCFFERETGYLFTGDLVYKDVLFAYYPSTDPEAYLASMERAAALPVRRVFPGHHSLDIQPEILTRIRDAFRRLKEEGKLRHGGGQFDCGDFGIWV